MATEVYVFALLGGLAVLALFGWVLWIAGEEAYDMARHWRYKRQLRYVDRLLERRERARDMAPLSAVEVPPPPAACSPSLGARCWLLDDATDPASGGRACTVVLRDDVSGAVIEVAATDPRIYTSPSSMPTVEGSAVSILVAKANELGRLLTCRVRETVAIFADLETAPAVLEELARAGAEMDREHGLQPGEAAIYRRGCVELWIHLAPAAPAKDDV